MWQQLQIKATADNAELIGDLLLGLGSEVITLLDAQDQPLLEPGPGELPLWDEAWVSALFPADTDFAVIIRELETMLNAMLNEGPLEHRLVPLADKNWTQEWLQYFQPICFGERLWICASEQAHTITQADGIKVLLDPGLAFGTGSHPTTAMCLEWLAEHLKTGQTVIDYGCGSGILAIAALKLGASQVYAIDNDPQALEATADNARKNQIDKHALVIAQPEQLPTIQADIIIANILANPLISLKDQFMQHLKSGGQLVLSGILQEQAQQLIKSYQPNLCLQLCKQLEEWCLVDGMRN